MASVVRKVVVSSLLSGSVSRGSVVASTTATNRTYFTYSNEPAAPVDHEPKWVNDFEAAVQCIKSGDTVFVQGAAATPEKLVCAMTQVGKQRSLKNVTVCHMHTEGTAPYTEPDCAGIFRSLSFFMGGNVRKPVAEGRSDTIPIFLQDIPKLFTRGIVKPDVALIQVSPPDQFGYCSLGTSIDCVRCALMHSKTIVAHVNSRMPRTFGDGIIHVSHFDYAIKHDEPLPDHAPGPLGEEDCKIAKLIAENLVEDGATLQMGIGGLPDAVLNALTNHKNLGIHSEMFAGGVIDLVNKGAITNNNKTIHQGKIIGSFLIGPQKLYDFVDNNPFVEMLRVDYVNNVGVISQNPKMTAINSAIEVDLTGQVCSDSIGTRMYSGFGGQVDFIRGAAEGFDGKGKPIIGINSATKKGVSKIVPTLKPGAGVVTTRAHVHYVVTEYGIAELFGRSIRQRAYALINVAHPSNREALEKAAFERMKVMPSP